MERGNFRPIELLHNFGGVGYILANDLKSRKSMALKCHGYKENNNTRFSFRFGKLLKSTSNTTLLNVMTFLVWKILLSEIAVLKFLLLTAVLEIMEDR